MDTPTWTPILDRLFRVVHITSASAVVLSLTITGCLLGNASSLTLPLMTLDMLALSIMLTCLVVIGWLLE